MVGRPEMLRMGDAESEHQAEVHVRAVIDRAFALEERFRTRSDDEGELIASGNYADGSIPPRSIILLASSSASFSP